MTNSEQKKKIAIATLGCKVNQYESAGILHQLSMKGFTIVPFGSQADLVIVNTCAVTEKTDYQSRQLIRRAGRMNPGAPIVVTGCYAQINPERISELPGVAAIAGTDLKEKLPAIIDRILKGGIDPISTSISGIPGGTGFSYDPGTRLPDHTRAFLKIQDGCNSFCSYCIVPYARGRSRSLEPDQVLCRINTLVAAGFKEIVLTGIHLGMYGLDLASRIDLLELLRRIEEHGTGLPRLRLSSIEPTEITDDLITHMAQSQILCRHLHVPLQSGSNNVLTRMKRCYSNRQFETIIRKVAATMPEAAIGLDVMAGFPGESEADHARTVELIADLPLAYLHVFPYSRRPGTEAAGFAGQVDERVKKARAFVLRNLGREKQRLFNARFLDQRLSVLIEEERDRNTGLLKGFSDNYIPVLIADSDGASLGNRIIEAHVIRTSENKVYGKIANGKQKQSTQRA
jgi:threonylcarbamoyladenosine tRNA methylthiotransferase MtaB